MSDKEDLQLFPLELSSDEALALLHLCLTSSTEYDANANDAVKKLAAYCLHKHLLDEQRAGALEP